jgi:hypothetical protein
MHRNEHSRRHNQIITLAVTLLLAASLSTPVLAQQGDQPQENPSSLTVFAEYPARRAAVGDSVTFDLTIRGGASAETVDLNVEGLPEPGIRDWIGESDR